MKLVALFKHYFTIKIYKLQDSEVALTSVFMGLGAFMMLAYFLIAGFLLPSVLNELDNGLTSSETLLSWMCYYFMIDLFLRAFLESQGGVNIKPYLTLPISKKTILYFLQYKAFFSLFNFLPFLLFSFSYIKVISPENGGVVCFNFFVLLFIHCLFNSTLSFHIGKTVGKKITSWAVILFSIGGTIFLEWKGYTGIVNYYTQYVSLLVKSPMLMLGVFILYILLFYTLSLTLKKYLSLEVLNDASEIGIDLAKLFNKESVLGNLMLYETRLILRSKKFRYLLPFQILFGNFYAATVLMNGEISSTILRSFALFMATLVCTSTYAGMFFSMESKFYPFLMTANIPIKLYVKSKYYILILLVFVSAFISCWTLFINVEYIFYIITFMLYTIGVVIPMMMYASTYNRKALDLDQSSFFGKDTNMNMYQFGVSFTFIIMLFVILGAFDLFDLGFAGLIVMSLLSVVGLFFIPKNIDLVSKKLSSAKFEMLESFKK
ncbi:DUF5687 family protein [Flammeovirga aprica]|uniref:Uncharacterized protein n=1 Tax=Flammeovirga aprica JL-4 TaxID=694437 RepID=A0A7X9RVX0_9BACT|nr:DUF5687 family protein [Flammeovirga aprica]NME69708.1 hypothetical protein [Flammeovirga aprica JL-4]